MDNNDRSVLVGVVPNTTVEIRAFLDGCGVVYISYQYTLAKRVLYVDRVEVANIVARGEQLLRENLHVDPETPSAYLGTTEFTSSASSEASKSASVIAQYVPDANAVDIYVDVGGDYLYVLRIHTARASLVHARENIANLDTVEVTIGGVFDAKAWLTQDGNVNFSYVNRHKLDAMLTESIAISEVVVTGNVVEENNPSELADIMRQAVKLGSYKNPHSDVTYNIWVKFNNLQACIVVVFDSNPGSWLLARYKDFPMPTEIQEALSHDPYWDIPPECSDWLSVLFFMQEKLNDFTFSNNGITANDGSTLTTQMFRQEVESAKLYPETNKLGPNTNAAVWMRKYWEAMHREVIELGDEIPWKWWSKSAVPLDKVHEELIDALHFHISTCLAAGLTAGGVIKAYTDKYRKNIERQKTNYVARGDVAA
jgi:hypothetical protein